MTNYCMSFLLVNGIRQSGGKVIFPKEIILEDNKL